MSDTQSTEPATRRKRSATVFDSLKRMIAGGDRPPGSLMPSERELMAMLGVGRPVIREAMQQLAGMGLISISHGERARVRQLTPQSLLRQVEQTAQIMLAQSADSLEHLKSARIFFERGVVREAAMRATSEDLADLRRLLEEQRQALGHSGAFIAADMRFHTRIAAISGNPIFTAVSAAMLDWLKQYHTELLIWSGKEKYTLAEHEEIIAHLAANDPDAAERAVVRHLERSRALYVPARHVER